MKLSNLASKNKRIIKNKIGAEASYKNLMVTGVTALGGLAVRKGAAFIWKKATNREAPKNPADHGVSWKEALMYAFLSALLASLVRVVIMRNMSIAIDEDA